MAEACGAFNAGLGGASADDMRGGITNHATDGHEAEVLTELITPALLTNSWQRCHQAVRGRHKVFRCKVLAARKQLVLHINAKVVPDLDSKWGADSLCPLESRLVFEQISQASQAWVRDQRHVWDTQHLTHHKAMWCHWVVQDDLYSQSSASRDEVVTCGQRARQRPNIPLPHHPLLLAQLLGPLRAIVLQAEALGVVGRVSLHFCTSLFCRPADGATCRQEVVHLAAPLDKLLHQCKGRVDMPNHRHIEDCHDTVLRHLGSNEITCGANHSGCAML
mmetsp:Transcript_169377/g.411797  ORF Transcript_169377/g.411797 Transcript_169377/m.411797 type:complete len:277 (-) Transcript_169377:78-908(-)